MRSCENRPWHTDEKKPPIGWLFYRIMVPTTGIELVTY